jgi:DNA-binding FrmR family transcriptional regulator
MASLIAKTGMEEMTLANLRSPFHMRLCAGLAAVFGILLPQSAPHAQSEADWQLMVEITQTISSIDEETAREAHAKCLDISQRIAAREDIEKAQRLYFEAMISHCISNAMNNGKYSDASGDQCSHRFDAATRLNQVIKMTEDKAEFAEFLPEFKHQLRNGLYFAEAMGCTQDFKALQME